LNAFESGARRVIPAVLIYARSGDDVLMLRKTTQNEHFGKWNGLGGKLEPDESPVQAAAREFEEESGVAVDGGRFRSLGWVLFPNFKAHKGEDWWVAVYDVELSGGEKRGVPRETREGELQWVRSELVPKLALWEGDMLFLPQVLRGERIEGTVWYRDGKVVRSEFVG
jgi:8-oxo-dGTP diphosphatase